MKLVALVVVLCVFHGPGARSKPVYVYVEANAQETFICENTRPESQVQWVLDGVLLSSLNEPLITITGTVMSIESVSKDYNGTKIECRIYNHGVYEDLVQEWLIVIIEIDVATPLPSNTGANTEALMENVTDALSDPVFAKNATATDHATVYYNTSGINKMSWVAAAVTATVVIVVGIIIVLIAVAICFKMKRRKTAELETLETPAANDTTIMEALDKVSDDNLKTESQVSESAVTGIQSESDQEIPRRNHLQPHCSTRRSTTEEMESPSEIPSSHVPSFHHMHSRARGNDDSDIQLEQDEQVYTKVQRKSNDGVKLVYN